MILGTAGHDAGTVVGADTVCVVDEAVLGQPGDRVEAERMLLAMIGREHRVVSGVCFIDLASGTRRWLADVAWVRLGDLPEDALGDYLGSGDWRGKAGGYNLQDRIDAGWPLSCTGDPATVMGLPIRRMTPLFMTR